VTGSPIATSNCNPQYDGRTAKVAVENRRACSARDAGVEAEAASISR
jgi:hypothetical protein